jgi:cytochrome P450
MFQIIPDLGGHFFPKGAVVFPNLHDAHHNRGYWRDPENFRPERFLNETGTGLVKHEALMPFSTG